MNGERRSPFCCKKPAGENDRLQLNLCVNVNRETQIRTVRFIHEIRTVVSHSGMQPATPLPRSIEWAVSRFILKQNGIPGADLGQATGMRNEKTRQIISHWLELMAMESPQEESGHPGWPERSAIQPANCRELLGDLFILESDTQGIRYRLAGTRLCDLHGRELRGEEFTGAFGGDDSDRLDVELAEARAKDHALLILTSGVNKSGDSVNLETVLLPLMNNGEPWKRILGLTTAWQESAWVGYRELVGEKLRAVRRIRPWLDSKETAVNSPDGRRRPFDPQPNEPRFKPVVYSPSPPLDLKLPSPATPGIQQKVGHLTVIEGGKPQ